MTFHFASYAPASSRITPGGSVTFTPDAGQDFDGTTGGPSHHPLYFDNASVGNVTSGSAPVTKTFATAGVYTYYCAFHAPFGMKGKITVTTNQLPTASFTVASTGTNVSFDASASSDPDGAITKYQWDFNNDGTVDETDTTPTAQHTFSASATVALTVVDNNADAVGPEASAPATQSVAVAAPLPPPTAPTTPKPPTGDKIKPKIALVTKALHLAALRGGTAKLSFTVSERRQRERHSQDRLDDRRQRQGEVLQGRQGVADAEADEGRQDETASRPSRHAEAVAGRHRRGRQPVDEVADAQERPLSGSSPSQ